MLVDVGYIWFFSLIVFVLVLFDGLVVFWSLFARCTFVISTWATGRAIVFVMPAERPAVFIRLDSLVEKER